MDLFHWVAKIWYGLLFRELLLPLDRARPNEGSIIPQDHLEEYTLHHLLLQGIRGVVETEESPASIYVFEAKQHADRRLCFDYRDSFLFPFLSLRVGESAILAFLQDWGLVKESWTLRAFEAASEVRLHPIQFQELATLGLYVCSLYERPPHTITAHGRDRVQVVPVKAGFSTQPRFRPFNPEEYASALRQVLSHYLTHVPEGPKPWTYLTDDSGHPVDLHDPKDGYF